jgi:hypothetical protein
MLDGWSIGSVVPPVLGALPTASASAPVASKLTSKTVAALAIDSMVNGARNTPAKNRLDFLIVAYSSLEDLQSL